MDFQAILREPLDWAGSFYVEGCPTYANYAVAFDKHQATNRQLHFDACFSSQTIDGSANYVNIDVTLSREHTAKP